MRKCLLLVVLISVTATTHAQPVQFDRRFVDSITARLPTAPDDTVKVLNLRVLASMYLFVKPALTIKYGNEGTALAKRLHYPSGLIGCLGQTAFCYAITGEWAKAINDVNQAIPLCQKYYPQGLVYMYNILFVVAYSRGNYADALEAALTAYHQPTFLAGPEINRWPTYMQLGRGYERINRLDSAIYFGKIALTLTGKYAAIVPDLANNSYILSGDIAAKQGKFAAAIIAYRSGAHNVGIASVYHVLQQHDSAISYAELALNEGWRRKLPNIVQDASLLLAKEYAASDPKQANAYLKIYIASKDSLYNSDKLKQVEETKLAEQRNHYEVQQRRIQDRNSFIQIALLAGLVVAGGFSLLLWRNNRFKKKANQQLEQAYNQLKETQQQLVQQEKMASLGELTAGIAHEIQNPLNFVNNFSEISKELITELVTEVESGHVSDVKALAEDALSTMEKVVHHGKRADAIVRSMMEHSRRAIGKQEPTGLNALVEQYLQLAYHGYRAKDKTFNTELRTFYDQSIDEVTLAPQEVGRVLLNLFNNAFYAVQQKKTYLNGDYKPLVSVSTQRKANHISIAVTDNGTGMSKQAMTKAFQPFFTTKPTGEGTGLGLSLSYDIITKGHRGELRVESKEGESTTFMIVLPVSMNLQTTKQ